jgi:hypothetical protein
VEKLVSSLGGQVEAFYFAFGDTDVYVIADLPDHASVTAASLAAHATGAVTVKTTGLMTPEEVDKAAKKTPDYQPLESASHAGNLPCSCRVLLRQGYGRRCVPYLRPAIPAVGGSDCFPVHELIAYSARLKYLFPSF